MTWWETMLIASLTAVMGWFIGWIWPLLTGARPVPDASSGHYTMNPVPEEDLVTVRLYFHPEAWERVWTAAAFAGLSHTHIVNWSVVILEKIMTSDPGTRLTWADPDGREHAVVVRK